MDSATPRAATPESPIAEGADPVAPAAGPAPAAEVVRDPHQGLRPLAEAARRCRARVLVLRVPMRWDDRPRRSRTLELLTKLVVFLPPHLRLVARLWRARDHDLVIVREFLTQVLLLVWPLIWPLRRKVHFLVNHNLQEAHERPLERAFLRLLWRTGIRLACLETADGLAELGIRSEPGRLLVLPHPLGPLAPPRRPDTDALPVIGVIGELRPEKGSHEVLEALVQLRDAGRLRARLLLGCPNPAAAAGWQAQGFEVQDTRATRDYVAALDRADVVVLNYRRERYFYRASGVAADALTRRAAVIAPDFPVMRHQLDVPARVGVPLASVAALEAALQQALALRPGLDGALRRQAAARDPAALATLLDAFVARRGEASAGPGPAAPSPPAPGRA